MDAITIIAFILYFVVVLGIGYYFYHKTHSMEDYVLGGRELNPYVSAMSAQASDMSGWLLLGLPGAIFVAGLGEIWIGIGLAIGSYLAWLFVAKRLRVYSEKCGNALTVPEFFSNRFRDEKGYLRLVSSIVILVFFTFYVTSGFVSGGNVFISIFGGDIDYKVAVWITAAIIVVYTFMGGFKAVCWTDFVQALLMLFAIIIVPLAALGHIDGGWDNMINIVNNEVDHFTSLGWDGGKPITAIVLVSCLAWGLGYFGMPHIIVRYMAIKNPEEVKIARRIGTAWIVLALIGAALIGMIGHAWAVDNGIVITNPERIFLEIIGSGIFATFIAGILYAALMAAVMSTADSQLLVASSAVTNDLYAKYAKGEHSDEKLMWISRGIVIVVALLAAVFAMDENSSIMSLVSFAWSGFGAAFGPIMILALFWKRINAKGALAGMLTGFIVDVVWNTFFNAGGIIPGLLKADWCVWNSGLYELLPAFILALIAAVVVSLLTEEPSEEMQKEFDEATEGNFW